MGRGAGGRRWRGAGEQGSGSDGHRGHRLREQSDEIAAQKDQIQHAYETVELLSDIGREITASLDLDTILFKLGERVNTLLDASIFGVGLYRLEQHQIEYTLAIESGKRYLPSRRDTLDKNQFAVWCIDSRKPVLLERRGRGVF